MDKASMAIALEATLIRHDVDKSLLPFTECASLLTDLEDKYSLGHRVSAKDLISQFGEEVLQCQASYHTSLMSCITKLKNNMPMAQKMDETFGTCEHDAAENSTVTKTSDGRIKLRCLYPDCKTETVKLKRHLEQQHGTLEDDSKFAMEASKIMANNSINKGEIRRLPSYVKKPSTATVLVSRRHNFRVCPLCDKLFKNLGQHLLSFHDVANDTYHEIMKTATVMPSCFTKKLNGKNIPLSGNELKAAEEQFGPQIRKQTETLEGLKTSRIKIAELRADIRNGSDKKEELNDVLDDYNKLRYQKPDLSLKLKEWNVCFKEYLTKIENHDPKRASAMALKVIQPFEDTKGDSISFDDINPVSVRRMLNNFKSSPGLTATSKLKYVKAFETFILFLISDIESPERREESLEERAARGITQEEIKREFESMHFQLSKKFGGDLVMTRRRAKAKLMKTDELTDLRKERSKALEEALEEDWDVYTKEQINRVRDDLIAVGALKLGRRTKEMMTMTCKEVEEAEEREINDERFHIIKVMKQKNLKSGKEAPVAFSSKEFTALTRYIDVLRPKLALKENCDEVFTTVHKEPHNNELSFSGIYNIMQNFTTSSGKKLSTRSVRGSLITNSRDHDLTDQQAKDRANSMSHTVTTAERYYNHKDISDSVVNTLLLDDEIETSAASSRHATSTPKKTVSSSTLSTVSASVSSTPTASTSNTPTPSTSKIIRPTDLNETFKTLRSKKVVRVPRKSKNKSHK